jgi:hypothetical protein
VRCPVERVQWLPIQSGTCWVSLRHRRTPAFAIDEHAAERQLPAPVPMPSQARGSTFGDQVFEACAPNGIVADEIPCRSRRQYARGRAGRHLADSDRLGMRACARPFSIASRRSPSAAGPFWVRVSWTRSLPSWMQTMAKCGRLAFTVPIGGANGVARSSRTPWIVSSDSLTGEGRLRSTAMLREPWTDDNLLRALREPRVG